MCEISRAKLPRVTRKSHEEKEKVSGFEFEVIVSSLSGDLSEKIAKALEKKLAKEEKHG